MYFRNKFTIEEMYNFFISQNQGTTSSILSISIRHDKYKVGK